jgi:transcriptional regulator with XRE-family HTH domain
VGADGWLTRGREATAEEVSAVLRGWRLSAERTQAEVADVLGVTQQHLSQMENGRQPVSLEQRRLIVTELGIAAENLGLSSGKTRRCRCGPRSVTRATRPGVR